jgi:hypothetical protein
MAKIMILYRTKNDTTASVSRAALVLGGPPPYRKRSALFVRKAPAQFSDRRQPLHLALRRH